MDRYVSRKDLFASQLKVMCNQVTSNELYPKSELSRWIAQEWPHVDGNTCTSQTNQLIWRWHGMASCFAYINSTTGVVPSLAHFFIKSNAFYKALLN